METKKTPPPIPPRKRDPQDVADAFAAKIAPARPPKKAGFVPSPDATSNAEVVKDPTTKRPKFVSGNQLWQLVKNAGRRVEIANAAELWQKAIEYFKWCDENPLNKVELVKHQGDAEPFDVALGRPYSMDALTIYAGVSASYFRTRKLALGDKAEANTATTEELDLLDTIRLIEGIVRSQRFEGAAVGIYKENLISRVDGYADNINQHNTGEVRQNIVVRDQKTADDLAKLDKML